MLTDNVLPNWACIGFIVGAYLINFVFFTLIHFYFDHEEAIKKIPERILAYIKLS